MVLYLKAEGLDIRTAVLARMAAGLMIAALLPKLAPARRGTARAPERAAVRRANIAMYETEEIGTECPDTDKEVMEVGNRGKICRTEKI